jgi:hypothetical protein
MGRVGKEKGSFVGVISFVGLVQEEIRSLKKDRHVLRVIVLLYYHTNGRQRVINHHKSLI